MTDTYSIALSGCTGVGGKDGHGERSAQLADISSLVRAEALWAADLGQTQTCKRTRRTAHADERIERTELSGLLMRADSRDKVVARRPNRVHFCGERVGPCRYECTLHQRL
jgi:hypothetical protein